MVSGLLQKLTSIRRVKPVRYSQSRIRCKWHCFESTLTYWAAGCRTKALSLELLEGLFYYIHFTSPCRAVASAGGAGAIVIQQTDAPVLQPIVNGAIRVKGMRDSGAAEVSG